jgi:hypothetical protein
LFLLFDFSEIGEILRLKHTHKEGLVSYPEWVNQGVNYRIGEFRTWEYKRRWACAFLPTLLMIPLLLFLFGKIYTFDEGQEHSHVGKE